MKIFIGTDHAGFELKQALTLYLKELGYEVEDMGAYEFNESDDYPDFIAPVAEAVAGDRKAKGIILGGSGQGEAIGANRFRGVRAAVYYGGPRDIIRLSREHNDANILSLGARFISEDEAKEAVKLWLETEFGGEERHLRRIEKIDNIQDEFDKWNHIKKKTNSSKITRFFHEGDVFYVQCGKNIGFEQDGKGEYFERPVLVLRKFNKHVFLGLPLTTAKKDNKYYFSVGVVAGKEAAAILSQIRLYDQKRIINKLDAVSKVVLMEIKEKLKAVSL